MQLQQLILQLLVHSSHLRKQGIFFGEWEKRLKIPKSYIRMLSRSVISDSLQPQRSLPGLSIHGISQA